MNPPFLSMALGENPVHVPTMRVAAVFLGSTTHPPQLLPQQWPVWVELELTPPHWLLGGVCGWNLSDRRRGWG